MAPDMKKAPAVRQHQIRGNDRNPLGKETIMNFRKNATSKARHVKAQAAMRTVTTRVRGEAETQGLSIIQFHHETGLAWRDVLRLWLGRNPSAWSIDRAREVLGLSIEQVWKLG